jgi:diguanylate cyclase (GGDEF)-like protein
MTSSATNPQTIGVIVDSLVSYQQMLLAGIYTAALEAGFNVVVYVGRELNPVRVQNRPANEIYKLVPSDLLGLIVFAGGIGHYLNDLELEAFLGQFAADRTVCLSRAVRGLTSVLVDNEPGMRDLMEHLIVTRGLRKFAFMRGFEHNQESQLRERVFKESLERHGIAFNPDHLLRGDFFRTPAFHATLEFLDTSPDVEVIVAANDDMAYGVIRALQERGLRVPQDIAVTGFDDTELSVFTNPALTTVRQPLFGYGEQAVHSLLQLVNGQAALASVSLPTELIVRDSCDQHPRQPQSATHDRQARLFSVLLEHAKQRFSEQYEFRTLHLLETNLMAVDSLPELWVHLPEYLLALGIQRCFVVLYPQPGLQPASTARLAFAFQNGETLPVDNVAPFATSSLLPKDLHSVMTGMMLVQPLFVGETQYGLFLTDANNGQRLYHEPLNSLLSGSIHNVHQTTALRAQTVSLEERIVERTRELEQTNTQLHAEIQQRHNAEIALRQANITLRELVSLDGLTGLYNRAAFDEFLEQHWAQHAQDQLQLSLILIDIDHFKKYNDHYGHVPGDESLRAVANVLKACVQRANDMVARYGGEEFAIVLTDTSEAGSEIVIARVQAAIAQLAIPHEQSDVAPTLSVSIGVCTRIPNADQPSASLIEQADHAMYEAKQHGRNQHRRSSLESNQMVSNKPHS